MVEVRIGDWLREGFELVRADWGVFVVAAIALVVLGGVLTSSPYATVSALLYGPLAIGYFAMCFKRMRGEHIEIRDIFRGFRRFGRGVAIWAIGVAPVTLLVAITCVGALGLFAWAQFQPDRFTVVLVVLLGVGLGGNLVLLGVHVVLFFALQRVADQPDVGAWDAIRDSWGVVRQAPLMFALCAFVFGLIAYAGCLAFWAGSALAHSWITAAMACAYRDCFGLRPPAAPPPPPTPCHAAEPPG
jgi:hypothetical protein